MISAVSFASVLCSTAALGNWPFTMTMRSPWRTPACSAGDPGANLVTLSRLCGGTKEYMISSREATTGISVNSGTLYRGAVSSAARKAGETLALRQEAAPLSKRMAIYRNVLRLLACLSPKIERKANVCSRRGTVFRGLDCMILPPSIATRRTGGKGVESGGELCGAKREPDLLYSI